MIIVSGEKYIMIVIGAEKTLLDVRDEVTVC